MNGTCSSCHQTSADSRLGSSCACFCPHPPVLTPPRRDLSDLASLRVLQRTLVYIVGLSPAISNEEILLQQKFLGQYGEIKKCVVNRNSSYKHGANGFSYGVYVTYANQDEAASCIAVRPTQAVDGFMYDGRVLKASLGTTKYCSVFLRGAKCLKPDCLFLHQLGPEQDTYRREEISVSIQPQSAKLTYTRVLPDGLNSVFPPVQTVRERRQSEDAMEPPRSPVMKPQRHMSMDVDQKPVRKNSRYDWATEGEGEVDPPEVFQKLLPYASPTEPEAPVPLSSYAEHLEPLIAPDSPDKWLLDVVATSRSRTSSFSLKLESGRLLFNDPAGIPEQEEEVVLVRSRSSLQSM